MEFKFEKLEIWNLSIDFANDVHLLTRKFPKDELYSLSSQFKRAADSISLNISEGCIGQSDREQTKFLKYAIRSTAECVTCLYLSKKRGYISETEFHTFRGRAEKIFAKTTRFKQNLKEKTKI